MRSAEANDDLLTRLAPGGGVENFITNALCWLLERTDFEARFLDQLAEADKGNLLEIGKGSRWTTHENFILDGAVKQPDMVCRSADTNDANTGLIFEHKVDADLHPGQLNDYRLVGEQEFGESRFRLILITARESQLGQNPDCHLLWRQIHEWLSAWLAEDHEEHVDEVTQFVSRSFLRLLEEKGLGPMEPITRQQLQAIPRAVEGERRIRTLANSVAEHPCWQKLRSKADEIENEIEKEMKFRWGRYGLYLLGGKAEGTWKPGIFVGVMRDSRDHGPPSVNEQEGSGPVACLIIDVNRKKHAKYEYSQQFSNLVHALKEHWPGNKAEDWRVHREGVHGKKGNLWHPVAIHKPLEAVLGNACSGDHQVDSFVKEVGRIAKEVINLKEFRLFREFLNTDNAVSQ